MCFYLKFIIQIERFGNIPIMLDIYNQDLTFKYVMTFLVGLGAVSAKAKKGTLFPMNSLGLDDTVDLYCFPSKNAGYAACHDGLRKNILLRTLFKSINIY